MNKKELMGALWIPITRRLPPDSEDLIFTYNSKNGYCACFTAFWAREYAEIMLEDPKGVNNQLSWDRQLTHWMPSYPPEGKKSFAEYLSPKKKKNK